MRNVSFDSVQPPSSFRVYLYSIYRVIDFNVRIAAMFTADAVSGHADVKRALFFLVKGRKLRISIASQVKH